MHAVDAHDNKVAYYYNKCLHLTEQEEDEVSAEELLRSRCAGKLDRVLIGLQNGV